MRTATIIALVLALVTSAPARAERPPEMGGPFGGGPGGRPGPPAFLEHVFPPSLIMGNQEAIGLTDAQRKAIIEAMGESEKQLLELRWKLEAESEKLGKLLDAAQVDESAALAQADRVMELEGQLKRAHLALLLRIKNQLTPAQQEKLKGLKRSRMQRRMRR
jgi:Spy/CpxP family protein refolding chaperone